jgi:mannose-1-phosphate guanylyltransferase/mannose-6-phosphate isomerase
MTIYPVIMCGGSGTRLWPASRPNRPKQFIPLIGDHSTFQRTVLRLGEIQGARRPLVISGAVHLDWVRRNLDALGLDADVLLEPEPRDSAAAVAVAAAWVAARDPDAVVAIVAADHHIPDAAAFARAVETAATAAAEGWIVTLGVRPDAAAIAYGYIAAGAPILGDVLSVTRFIEKPDLERARSFVEAGYLWNSGNFIASARTLVEAFARHAPAVGDAARLAVERAKAVPGAGLLDESFLSAPKISFDYAVMEKTDRTAVLPVAFSWSDLGAWDAIRLASPQDAQGNAVSGDVALIDVKDSLVRLPAHGLAVTLLGLSNVAVVADETHLLIANLAFSQGVKTAAEQARGAEIAPIERLKAHAQRYDQWLRTAALPLWWSVGADHANGGYFDLLGQAGRPVDAPRRARVQARQSFVYAEALRMGAPGGWRPAAEHGLAYLKSRFKRPDGRFRTLVDAQGAPLDDDAYLYDQAFFLMASATLATVVDDPAPLRAECEALLGCIEQTMAHPEGGFKEAGEHPFQSNAHMHLLEAALAWIAAGDDGRWRALGERLVDLALGKFIDADGGFLREFFDSSWRPAPGADGRLAEPGHQFEWAWLIARWSRLTGSAPALAAAKRLFEVGVLGVDTRRSVAVDALDQLDRVRSARARLWPQTEYLKAALMLAECDQTGGVAIDYLAHASRAADGLWRYLDVPVRGLWRDKMLEDGEFVDEAAPASSLYHIVAAIAALRPLGALA